MKHRWLIILGILIYFSSFTYWCIYSEILKVTGRELEIAEDVIIYGRFLALSIMIFWVFLIEIDILFKYLIFLPFSILALSLVFIYKLNDILEYLDNKFNAHEFIDKLLETKYVVYVLILCVWVNFIFFVWFWVRRRYK